MPRGWLGVAVTALTVLVVGGSAVVVGPAADRAAAQFTEAQAFRPLVPSRVLDTRMPGQGPALGQGAVRNVQLAGVAGIPANAVAVALNVTVTEPTSSGFVSLFPAGTPWAGNSNLNFTAGQTVPNMVLVGLGAGGQVSILNWVGATHVVVDVTGWFTNGFRPITPTRLLDTRVAGQGPALVSGETRHVAIGGRAGIPNGDVAVALNVTVVGAGTSGFLSVFPAGTGWPGTSSVNFLPGQVVPNMALVGLGSGGKVSVLGSGGPVHVIVDATGWFADGFHAVTPARVADTRTGRCGVRLGQGDRRSIEILGEGGVPVSGAAAAALNVTATNPTSSSYLTVYPKGSARPVASNLNVVRDQTVANMVMTGIGDDGAVVVYNSLGTVDVIIDVTGWLEGPTSARALLDCQVLPAPAPRAPPGFNIPPGSFVAGVHVPAGRYVGPGGPACVWQRRGAPGEVLGSGGGGGGGVRLAVDLVGGEGFVSSGCGTWIGFSAPPGPSSAAGDGDWVVSEDLVPGVYQSSGAAPCAWEQRMGFTGAPGEELDDGLAFGVAFVEIAPFEVGFRSRGCGFWRWVGPPTE